MFYINIYLIQDTANSLKCKAHVCLLVLKKITFSLIKSLDNLEFFCIITKRRFYFIFLHYIIISFQHPDHDLHSTCVKCFCREHKACLLSQKLLELKAGSENSNSLIRRASKGQCHIILCHITKLRSQQENSFWKELPFNMCINYKAKGLKKKKNLNKMCFQLTRCLCCMQLGLRVLCE